MPTEIRFTLGGGTREFQTFAAIKTILDAAPTGPEPRGSNGDLVASDNNVIIDFYNDQAVLAEAFTFTSLVTDSTRNVQIIGHGGTFASSMPSFGGNNPSAPSWINDVGNVIYTNIRFINSANTFGSHGHQFISGLNVIYYGCRFTGGTLTSSAAFRQLRDVNAEAPTAIACIFEETGGDGLFVNNFCEMFLYQCGFVNNGTFGCNKVLTNGAVTAVNCWGIGNPSGSFGGTGYINSSNNAADDGTAPGTAIVDNALVGTIATDFVDYPSGDYTPVASGVLDGSGADLTGTVVNDINGIPYSIPFEVGPIALPPPVDTVLPVITLQGANPDSVLINTSWTDPQALVTDNIDSDRLIDGDISALNLAVLGSYPVPYNAQDVAGNDAVEVIRMVDVISGTPDPTFTGTIANQTPVVENAFSLDVSSFFTNTVDYTVNNPAASINSAGLLTVPAPANGSAPVDLTNIIITGVGADVVNVDSNAFTLTWDTTAWGVRGQDIPASGGSIASLFYYSLSLPADNDKLYRGDNYVYSAQLIGTGTLDAEGVGTFTNPPVGVHTVTGDLYEYNALLGSVTLTITVLSAGSNIPPTANAGADGAALVGETRQLDGNLSSDPETAITFLWSIESIPVGSTATLTNTTTATPSWTTFDVEGSYIARLVVNDGTIDSAPDFNTTTVSAVVTPGAPTITILGNNPESVIQGEVYTDAGATALDAIDGNLTTSIVTVNTVNTANIGQQTVLYTVTNSNSLTTQATRIVNVILPAECIGPVNVPETDLINGTDLEKLQSIGASVSQQTVSVAGQSCMITVDYSTDTSKTTERTSVLGTEPEDNDGLGYDYPTS